MALQKQPININFSQGLDTKNDPFQLPVGKFLSLQNSIFDKQGLLQKRNGFAGLTSLSDTSNTYLTTFKNNLTAIGTHLNAYSSGSQSWVDKGTIQPVTLETLSIIRSNTNQVQSDSAIAPNGLVCTVFTDNVPSGGSIVRAYKYVIADSATGQNIVAPTAIPVSSGTVTGSPRVFLLGSHFVVVFTNVVSATNHLQYVAINYINPSIISVESDLSTQYTPSTTVNFDGVVCNNSLYLAWNGNDGGGAIRMTSLDSTLRQSNTVTFATRVATIMSVTADTSGSTPVIYASFYNSGTSTGYILAVNPQLLTVLAPTQIIASGTVLNITAVADNGIATVFYEVDAAYSYDSSIHTHFIKSRTCTQAGSLGTATTVVRSVGLASKACIINDTPYFLGIYSSTYQPTYFLFDNVGNVVAKLAYSNAGSYYTLGLPSAIGIDSTIQIPYLFKDLLESVNRSQGANSTAGVYSQTGINLATFTIGSSRVSSSEIGNNLHLSGGFLWMYDGYVPVEHSFHLWPDYVEVSASTTGGTMTAQEYFYQAIYEWTDNQGNIHRSAPSIPVSVTTTGSTSSVTVNVPTLRLTYKTANPVKIVIYRWSTAQETYFQVTSTTIPTLNSTTTDSIAFVDTQPDSAIIGNSIIYTTGGVLENIAAPATSIMTLWDNRLWLIPAEDEDLIWYSKQVIESTPVEMSDLLTIYTAPTTSSSSSTGPTKAAAPMDDKLILFKAGAAYYINGRGPDNTGSNSQYSDATFITSAVGCSNQQSIVLIPNGLMFQSGKGIWLLGRDLSTSYIGAPVEDFTTNTTVLSAVSIPNTNQVRFTLDSGVTLMYDYFYGQWSTFTNIPALSSTIYNNLHTYINSFGQVFQETPNLYLDGSKPVLMSFTTGWLNLAGVQGYERFYEMLLLGVYISPFKLNVQIAYDYANGASQSVMVTPNNYTPTYGGEQLWGSGQAWGGIGNKFEARVFPNKQKVESFQLTVTEIYDSSYGQAAGAGLTLSGINMVVGMKKGYRTSPSSRSFG